MAYFNGRNILLSIRQAGAGYSETEHAVSTWLDGKTVYEKTYVFSALGTDSTRLVSQALGIDSDSFKLDQILEARGELLGSGISAPLPYVPLLADGTAIDVDKSVHLAIDTASKLIKITNGETDRSGYKAYVTLRYTKKQIINLYTEEVVKSHTEDRCAVITAPWNTGLNTNSNMVAEWVPVTVGKQYTIKGAAGKAGGIAIGWSTAKDTTGYSSGHWGTKGGDFNGQTASFTADQPYVVFSRIKTEEWSSYGLWEV